MSELEEISYTKDQLKKVWHLYAKSWSKQKTRIVWDFINKAADGERFCVDCIVEDGFDVTKGERDYPTYKEKARVVMGIIRKAIEKKRICDLPAGSRTGREQKAVFMAIRECHKHAGIRVYGILATEKEFMSVRDQEMQVITGHVRNQEKRNTSAVELFPETFGAKRIILSVKDLALKPGAERRLNSAE
jgi:hypothetical protein